MRLLTRIANFFRPKEFRKAISEGETELKEAKKKAKREAKEAKSEYRHAMRRSEIKKAKEELHEAEEHIWKASNEASKVIVDWTAVYDTSKNKNQRKADEKLLAGRLMSQEEKEERLAKELQKGFKVMKTDRLERMSETTIKLYRDLGTSVKEAYKLGLIIDKEFNAQEDLLMESERLIARKKQVNGRIVELFKKSDAELLSYGEKEITKLLRERSDINRRLQDIFVRVKMYADRGSKMRVELNNILLVLEPLEYDAKLFSDRISDEVKSALERIRFEGEIAATASRASRKIAEEIREEHKASKMLEKEAGRPQYDDVPFKKSA